MAVAGDSEGARRVDAATRDAGAAWAGALSLALLAVLVLWAELAPASIRATTYEDGPIEMLTAALFLIAGAGFVATAFRAETLRRRGHWSAYFFVACWAGLMFVFFGEELSWGQRFLGIETPEMVTVMNRQKELNLHNLEFVETFAGGQYRYLSIFMLLTGLVIPLAARMPVLGPLMQRLAFPVCPLRYVLLFVGCYAFGRYYQVAFETIPEARPNDAAELRELVLGLGMVAFAWHGVFRPQHVFRSA